MDVEQYMAELGAAARKAAREVAASSTQVRNRALLAAAESLDGARDRLLEANKSDLDKGAASSLEAPLMDLIHSDVLSQLVGKDEEVIYLGDKNRISGVDCHQVAIRLADADVQIWVQEGDKPLPRRMMITSKWEGGAPRFIADMQWQEKPQITPGTFDFGAPEGASEIQFSPAD